MPAITILVDSSRVRTPLFVPIIGAEVRNHNDNRVNSFYTVPARRAISGWPNLVAATTSTATPSVIIVPDAEESLTSSS